MASRRDAGPRPAGRRPSALAVAQGPDPVQAKYVIQRDIGRGTYGRVCLASTREGPLQVVALKFLARKGIPDEEVLWRREVRILEDLDHPNVVRLLASYLPIASRQELVLAFSAADMDLRRFLERRAGKVSDATARQLTRQAGLALDHIHSRRIIHRDVKPANLLLTFDDDSRRLLLQVADFGLARIVGVPRGRPRLRTKVATDSSGRPLNEAWPMTPEVCTAWYRAPELMAAPLPVDLDERLSYSTAVDVWSLGAVAYELIAAEYLAPGDTNEDTLGHLIAVLGPPPRSARAAPWLARLVDASMTGMARDPMPAPAAAERREAWDVARATLQWDPARRPTARQLCREWPWLAPEPTGPSPTLPSAPLPGAPAAALAAPQATFPEAPGTALAAPQGQRRRPIEEVVKLGMCDDETPLPAPKKRRGKATCACSGHCWTPGHRYWGCNSDSFSHVASTHCKDCECSVTPCRRPRHHGPLCFRHAAIAAGLPLSLKLCRAARGSSMLLLPTDLQDFLCAEPDLDDLPFLLLLALLKEPAATRAFREVVGGGPCRDAGQLLLALERVARALDGCPNAEEASQLSRRGP